MPHKETTKTTGGMKIKTTEHDSGRKDVNIEVNSIDVKETDEATLKAKEYIEKKVIPELANRIVTAIVIHKPTNKSTSTKIQLPRVRGWAEFVVSEFKTNGDAGNYEPVVENDFTIVEVDHKTGDARVTTLAKYESE